jgi:hypothetical protein
MYRRQPIDPTLKMGRPPNGLLPELPVGMLRVGEMPPIAAGVSAIYEPTMRKTITGED